MSHNVYFTLLKMIPACDTMIVQLTAAHSLHEPFITRRGQVLVAPRNLSLTVRELQYAHCNTYSFHTTHSMWRFMCLKSQRPTPTHQVIHIILY